MPDYDLSIDRPRLPMMSLAMGSYTAALNNSIRSARKPLSIAAAAMTMPVSGVGVGNNTVNPSGK